MEKLENKNNIDRLARTILLLSEKNPVDFKTNTKDSVYVYPYRILIFNEIKDGELWFNGTDAELEKLCDKVTELEASGQSIQIRNWWCMLLD